MYQQVATFLIAALPALPFCASAQDSGYTVFRDKQAIGKLDSVADQRCDGCYTVRKSTVFGKELQLLIPVSVVSVNDTKKFSEDYTVEEHAEKNTQTLIVQNKNTSENFRLVFSAKNGPRLYVQRTASVSYHRRIAKGDYTDEPATQICRKTLQGKKAMPQVLDFRDFDLLKENTGECFNCPADMTIEECLKSRKSKASIK